MSKEKVITKDRFTINKQNKEPVEIPDTSEELFRVRWSDISGSPTEAKVNLKKIILRNFKKDPFIESKISDDLKITSDKLEELFKSFVSNLLENVANSDNQIDDENHKDWKLKLQSMLDIGWEV